MADKQEVLEALKHGNVFLTGGAGVGKSTITNEIIREYRTSTKQVVSLGSTGVSAVHEKRLARWKSMLPISEQLTLKIGVPILFTVNKWGKFVNGERGVLQVIEEDYLVVEKEDAFVRVERHEFDLLDMMVQ